MSIALFTAHKNIYRICYYILYSEKCRVLEAKIFCISALLLYFDMFKR